MNRMGIISFIFVLFACSSLYADIRRTDRCRSWVRHESVRGVPPQTYFNTDAFLRHFSFKKVKLIEGVWQIDTDMAQGVAFGGHATEVLLEAEKHPDFAGHFEIVGVSFASESNSEAGIFFAVVDKHTQKVAQVFLGMGYDEESTFAAEAAKSLLGKQIPPEKIVQI